jgi:hypothetical protein
VFYTRLIRRASHRLTKGLLPITGILGALGREAVARHLDQLDPTVDLSAPAPRDHFYTVVHIHPYGTPDLTATVVYLLPIPGQAPKGV